MEAVNQQQLKIDHYLANQMLQNTKTDDEIQTLQAIECAKIHVHGQTTAMVTIMGLESRFQDQQEAATRVTVPSNDILEWKSNFPLIDTCSQELDSMKNKYDEMFKQGIEEIGKKESRIDEELDSMAEGQTAKLTADKIADIVEDAVIVDSTPSPNSPVKIKLRREIEDALNNGGGLEQKPRITKVMRNILHEGIDISLRKCKRWGNLLNRRGQIGENRTMAAINQAVEGFMGISVMGMKTHSYLLEFLDRLNISLTYHNVRDPVTGRMTKSNEVEHDAIITWVEKDVLVLTIVESKTKELKPWAPSNQVERSAAAIKHATHALKQVLKDFITFKEIFLDIPKTMMEKIRFQYYVSLSDVSCEDWPSGSAAHNILFKEDIEDIYRLRKTLNVPDAPPKRESISADIFTLNTRIGARYVGGASLIRLKTPDEGFSLQGSLLHKIRTGYEGQLEKTFMMGREQQAVFQAGLTNYCTFGGHGSGKTVLLQSSIVREAQAIMADQGSNINHLMILCIWQKGADALLNQYKQLSSSLPKANNLEVVVLTKEELMRRFKATVQEFEPTTNQINTLCSNIDAFVKDQQVHLYIDEVWVTVPKSYSAHLTPANPNEVVGHIPFLRNGELYPWSKLNPGQVKLSVAVMPDCQHLLEKDLITAPPPDQGHVFTVFAPRSFRTTMRIHRLVMHIEERVEKDLRVWRYLLPPKDEKDGHEIMGSLPLWQPVNQTDHFICQRDGCDHCFLRNIEKQLQSHYSDAIKVQGANPDDIVLILSQQAKDYDALPAFSFLREKFPGVEIKFEDEFEGMEKAVVFNLTNGSIGTSPSIIPVSLTRANNHLVIFCEDFRNILTDAANKGLVKKIQTDLVSTSSNTDEAQIPTGLAEASKTLCNMARQMSFQSLKILAHEWGLDEQYRQLMNQEKTRFQMTRLMYQKKMEEAPFTTLAQFIESIRVANMSEAVTNKMAENLKSNIDDLEELITAKHLTDNEQIELAHSLDQRDMFNSLTQPEDLLIPAVSDQEALQRCLQSWLNQAQNATTEGLMKSLKIAGLSRIVSALTEKEGIRFEGASFENVSMKEQIKTTAFEVFLPLITTLMTVAYLTVLYSNNLYTEFWVLLCLHWIPSAILYNTNLYINYKFFGSSMNNPKICMLVMLVCQPVGSIILRIMHILRKARYRGQAVERYKMEKILRQAETSDMMNNFTSLLVIIFTLHMANMGTISKDNPVLVSLYILTAGLHMAKLFFNILKKQSNRDLSTEVFVQLGLISIPVASSLMIKASSVVILLSSATAYSVLCGCVMFTLALAANLLLEKKFLSDETEEEEKKSFLKAAHSLIFPLVPELQTKKQLIGVSLQLLVGNIAPAMLAFSVSLMIGVSDDIFITQNTVKSLLITVLLLIIYTTLAYYCILQQSLSLPTNDTDEDSEDLSESTPLLGNQNIPDAKASLKKAAYALVLLLGLLLILASCLPLLLYQFNTCPPFPSTPNSNITCDTTPQTFGSRCHLTCSPLFWSTSELHSLCLIRGVWSVLFLTCRPQVAAIVGPGWTQTLNNDDEPTTTIYPPSESRSPLPGLPIVLGSAAYIDGGILYCGGVYLHDASASALKSCYILKHLALQWEETLPLLQELKCASTAVIDGGQAMMVMGGMQGERVLSSTQIVRPDQPTQPGPDMTEISISHCSTTLQDGSVIVTGGQRKSNPYGSPKTEVYNFTTGKWRQLQDMTQRRFFHTCTQVLLEPDDPDFNILNGHVRNTSVLSVVVAGGFYFDAEKVIHTPDSVELYLPWNDTWIDLPNLPHWEDPNGNIYPMTETLIMSLQIAGDLNSLHLLRGASTDWNTDKEMMTGKVWHLRFNFGNHSYYWEDLDYDSDMIGQTLKSAAVGVPDTFFVTF